MDVERLDFIWRLVAMSVTSFSSWFHGCVNCFLEWGLYLAPLINQTLIRIVRHFMPILKAFILEMSVEGLRTFFINQYQRIQALRLAFFFHIIYYRSLRGLPSTKVRKMYSRTLNQQQCTIKLVFHEFCNFAGHSGGPCIRR